MHILGKVADVLLHRLLQPIKVTVALHAMLIQKKNIASLLVSLQHSAFGKQLIPAGYFFM